ncbi:hypothetical protein DAPPUDRAFT_251346 [Daphnia pulex]|uniref:Uncharacterized protein n=1 Tax=Daphnia pulex TaxID=6669 RepID=E9H078_DAPPU|nr:hypothetical protein DAPPUDRAFT_251346 [Daphnia pulex]|eukprot:EFX74859.1 hypothetical protein DAPPUDRAFT_251346 [Daphnia pulex]
MGSLATTTDNMEGRDSVKSPRLQLLSLNETSTDKYQARVVLPRLNISASDICQPIQIPREKKKKIISFRQMMTLKSDKSQDEERGDEEKTEKCLTRTEKESDADANSGRRKLLPTRGTRGRKRELSDKEEFEEVHKSKISQ